MQFIAQLFKQFSPGVSMGSEISSTIPKSQNPEGKTGLFSENLSHFLKTGAKNTPKAQANLTEETNSQAETALTEISTDLIPLNFLPEAGNNSSELSGQGAALKQSNAGAIVNSENKQMYQFNAEGMPRENLIIKLQQINSTVASKADNGGVKNTDLLGLNVSVENDTSEDGFQKTGKAADISAKSNGLTISKGQQSTGVDAEMANQKTFSGPAGHKELVLKTSTTQVTEESKSIDRTITEQGKKAPSPKNILKTEINSDKSNVKYLQQEESPRPVKFVSRENLTSLSTKNSNKQKLPLQVKVATGEVKQAPTVSADTSAKTFSKDAVAVSKDVQVVNSKNDGSVQQHAASDSTKPQRADVTASSQGRGGGLDMSNGNGSNKPITEYKNAGFNEVKITDTDDFLNTQLKAESAEKELAEITQKTDSRALVNQYIKNELPERLAKIIKQQQVFSNTAKPAGAAASHRLIFEDGNSVDISASKKDHMVQVHLANASQEIQRLLVKHADDIKILLQDRLQVEVELQFDSNEGSGKFELEKDEAYGSASERTNEPGNREDFDSPASKPGRIKYLGFNRNEWIG